MYFDVTIKDISERRSNYFNFSYNFKPSCSADPNNLHKNSITLVYDRDLLLTSLPIPKSQPF